MPLPRARYEAIQQEVVEHGLEVSCCPNLSALAKRHGVCIDTLASIYSQEQQYKVIKTHHVHKANMAQYAARYKAGEDLLALCCAVDFPPCLMLRRMLEHLLRLSKQRVGDILKHPELLEPCAAGTLPEPLLARLRGDMQRCARADRAYSPAVDLAKQVAGLEHEARLYAALRGAGLPFWAESELRAQGLFKTPDARLQVPCLMRAPGGGDAAWRPVAWLDSKATFGDARGHAAALEGQYQTYTNRYGPGAVIYWFGFVDCVAASDPQVLVLEAFPAPGDVRALPQLQG